MQNSVDGIARNAGGDRRTARGEAVGDHVMSAVFPPSWMVAGAEAASNLVGDMLRRVGPSPSVARVALEELLVASELWRNSLSVFCGWQKLARVQSEGT